MLPATDALKAYLAANPAVAPVDLYTFGLAGGSVLRYTSGPMPLTAPANMFAGSPYNYAESGSQSFALGLRFGRSTVGRKIGTDPTELDIRIFAGPDDLIGDSTWQEAIVAGLFDGAKVELDRFFLPPGGDGVTGPLDTSLGAIVWFYGLVADIDAGRSATVVKVKSMLNLLTQQQMPRRLYQSACTHIFGDPMCGYNRTAGTNAGGVSTGNGAITVTAIAGSSPTDIVLASGVAGCYGLGTCIGLSGANAGLSRAIISVAIPTVVGLVRALPFAVAVGDTFQLLPGCDHTTGTCQNTFNNLARFGGFPYIPPPEMAL